MTRLYTEEQVREMLRQVVRDTHFRTADAIELTYYDGHAERILAAATPVAAPDLSRLAEAVREACRDVADEAREAIDALDLAPIIAASGTGQGEDPCEGCGEPATGSDPEGTRLCDACGGPRTPRKEQKR